MINAPDKRFRRLLRWYPRSWRKQNGDVFVATLMEAAEAEGRSGPSSAELRSAVLHGIGARVDRRLSLTLSVTTLLLAAIVSTLTMSGVVAGGFFTEFGYPLLNTFLIPVLAATAVVAVIRDRGGVSDARALLTIGTSVIALSLAGAASWSWGLGFDAADAGITPPPLAQWWGALTIAGIAAGAAALALLTASLLRHVPWPPALRTVVAVLAAVITAPFIGFALLTPTLSALVAMTTLIMSLIPARNAAHTTTAPSEHTAPAERPRALSIPASRRHLVVRGLALVAAVAGIVGVAYAFTGAHWSGGAVDDTQAMARGIMILLLAALPLLAGFAIRATAHAHHLARHTWGPLTLAGLSLTLIATAYVNTPHWQPMAPWFLTGSLAAGISVAWWITPRLVLPRAAAVTIGSFAGLLYAALGGIMITPILAFAVPACALTLLLRPTKKSRERTHPAPIATA